LRIAQVAPPLEPVPPPGYGGTERVVHALVVELVRRGHDVTTFASGDSDVPGRLIATVPRALRPSGFGSDASGWFVATALAVLDRRAEFDVIHSHVEWYSALLARIAGGGGPPIVSTFHGRLDLPWARDVLAAAPGNYVAVSHSQASAHPRFPWTAVVHNGLEFDREPPQVTRGDALCFVGRVAAEKGILDTIEIARRAGRRLRIAAKVGTVAHERAYYDNVFAPALKQAGSDVEFIGELDPGARDKLFAESYASLMPGGWPEPFGLVSIESLACGTPVIARPAGALPEIIRDGVDGFLRDDIEGLAASVERVGELDRDAIRSNVIDRFSAARMADQYEAVYRSMTADRGDGRGDPSAIEAATSGGRATG
jgi:glycosyltransferase involved in cell wall biosynthesis